MYRDKLEEGSQFWAGKPVHKNEKARQRRGFFKDQHP